VNCKHEKQAKMAEEDAVFDPSLKKKKKKKKTFDLDAEMGTQADNAEDKVEVEDNKEVAEKDDDDLDLESFGKKKKKKKKVVDFEEEKGAEDAGEKEVAGDDDIDLESFGKKKKKKKNRDALDMDDLEEALPDDDAGDDLDLESFGKKKKKKKKDRGGDIDDDKDDDEDKENHDNSLSVAGSGSDLGALSSSKSISSPSKSPSKAKQGNESSDPWAQSDRDYTYDELLQRVFGIMRDKNPEMVAGEKKKFVMRPPQVVRVGTKKTAFVNFTEIAKMLHRQPKHLLAFLSAELGTVGAVDGNNQLIMKGRFQQKHIENVLRRYIKEYVTCHTCRSPDTILNKETRLFFLQCMTCHSRCSVQTIKTGFQAVTGKRSVMRAKQ